MTDQERLSDLKQQYHETKVKFIEAVEKASEKNELNSLQRRLETIATQIRKLDITGFRA